MTDYRPFYNVPVPVALRLPEPAPMAPLADVVQEVFPGFDRTRALEILHGADYADGYGGTYSQGE